MEVSIGVQNVAREVTVETDESADQVTAAVEAAIKDGSTLSITDTKGRRVLVPGQAIGWVQIGDPEKSRVGFGIS